MEVVNDVEFIQEIQKFSDENIHAPGSINFKLTNDLDSMLLPGVYANGVDADDKGYVSIDVKNFSIMVMYIYGYEISFFVSVLDAAGSKRFPTSYVFTSEKQSLPTDNRFRPCLIDHLIKRETLLREPEKLLPEDCLTLHFRVIVNVLAYLQRYNQIDSSIWHPFVVTNGEYRLPLDSTLGKRLIEVSSLFRGMPEKESGYVNIPPEETAIFKLVGDILLGENRISFSLIIQLYDIYVTADKYDIPVVMETCRCILSLLCRAAKFDVLLKVRMEKEILRFSKLRETRYDIRLKKIVDGYLERNYNDDHNDSRTVESAGDNPEAVWRIEVINEGCSYFEFVRGAEDYTEHFNFYQ